MRGWLARSGGVLLIFALLAAGCGKKGEDGKGTEAKGPAAAIVNGDKIAVSELDQRVDLMLKSGRGPTPAAAGQPDPMPEFRRMMLDQLIDERLMLQEASRIGVAPSDSEVTASVTQFRTTFPSDSAYAAALREYQTTPEMVEDNLRNELTYRAFVRKSVEPKVTVDSLEVKAFYETHQDQFIAQEEMIHARHILLRADSTSAPEARQAARKRAEEILALAKAPGTDFAALALQHSEDSASRVNGGDLGFFGKGQMDPDFVSAAWKLRAGQVGPIVQTRFGYHVIKMEERRKPGLVPLPEVAEQIRQYLLQQKVVTELQAQLKALRDKAKIEKKLPEETPAGATGEKTG
jgi:peptidyl-prolyl cis-trans isomerase C